MLNGKVDNLETAQSVFDQLTLEDEIAYAKWQVQVAETHLADLERQRAALDAHFDAQYAEHCSIENGKAHIIADAAECNECKLGEGC